MSLRKTALASAVAVSLGMSMAAVPMTASAASITASWSGLFTMLDPAGNPLANTSYPYYGDTTWGYGLRTQITGHMSFDTVSGAGSATVNSFDFFSGGPATAHDITMQAIGDGNGGGGSLVQGHMLFDWAGNNNIPVDIYLDASGFFGAVGAGVTTSDTISGVGAIPASDGIKKGKYPIGPAPMATTTFDTAFPTSGDGIGGVPMTTAPFPGYNANFDITSVHIDSISVPVPAAVWLFGSGLLGLVGVARRRKA
jgi:hypothetical protein